MDTSFFNHTSETVPQQFTVTVFSGDQVVFTIDEEGVNTIEVRPRHRAGSKQVRFIRVVINDDVYIYPTDFLTYVSKIIDKQLFNITRLNSYGYDDEKTSYIPLIIRLRAQISEADKVFFTDTLSDVLTVNHFLKSINAVAAYVNKDQVQLFHQLFVPNNNLQFPNTIKFIHLDKKMYMSESIS